MNPIHPAPGAAAADRFGRAVAARLQEGADALPHEVCERLRAAREQALQVRRRAAPPAVRRAHGHDDRSGALGFWRGLAAVLPLLALAAGLVLLHGMQARQRAAEIAAVDAALLTDDLPPAAYADPGFVQFLSDSAP